uniref:DAGKc domain-containing protein n=1 Tax=Ciona savignyi TaxID=51511 RepID=H2YXL6_CIOSA
NCFVLKLDLVTRSKDHKWRLQTLKFRSKSQPDCMEWCRLISSKLENALCKIGCERPQSLLVFINPFGGRHRAESIYTNTVSPIFDLANIKQTVIVTEYRDHAKKFVETEDISKYDGIVAVGGDGMFNEIANGLLLRTQRENKIPVELFNSDCPNSYKTPKIKLGVIPAGSTDCMSYVSQGINDPETAALHIMVGDTHPLDLCSLYEESGKFIRFSFSMTSYGYYGNVLRKSERLRHLGPSRYDFAGVQTFLKKHVSKSEIHFLPSSSNSHATDTTKCRYPCQICSENLVTPKIEIATLDSRPHFTNSISGGDVRDLKVVRGNYIMVNSAMMSCACGRSPQGLSPSAHLADGNMDLILVSNCSQASFIRYMLSHVGGGNRFDFPFVQVHRVKAFKHKVLAKPEAIAFSRQTSVSSSEVTGFESSKDPESTQTESCWNTDGELVESPNISVWVHRGLINIYARGVEN